MKTLCTNGQKITKKKWKKDEKLDKLLPDILPTNQVFESKVFGKSIKVGIGVHDSSASVTPYLFWAKEPFVLISTGTWCINMNPSNQNKLTVHELKNKCINYFSAFGKTIKSSRFFLGHIFNLNTKKIAEIYGTDAQSYKSIKYNESIIKKLLINNEIQFLFFKDGIPENYTSTLEPTGIFDCFEEAYHQLVLELVFINHKLLRLITNDGPKIKDVYISGGFAENPLFARLTATLLPEKNVYVSRISNASALGAALLVYKVFEKTMPAISLKRKKIKPFSFKIED